MTANPASTPIPSTTILPRMGRGVCWSDLARDIELDEQNRQTRAECTPTPEHVQTPVENEHPPEVPTPSLGTPGSSLGDHAALHRDTVIAEALLPLSAVPLEPPRGWLANVRRRFA